jgi:hypothetical protein
MTTFKYRYYIEFVDGTCKTYPSNNPFWAAHPDWNTDSAEGPRVLEAWRQGPKGGVKVMPTANSFRQYGYISKNEELMKEFAWVKLRATEL